MSLTTALAALAEAAPGVAKERGRSGPSFPFDVIFVDEPDPEVTPMGVKGLGEIGIVGTAGAVANAIYHATGNRQRSLPITIDKILSAEDRPAGPA